MTGLNAISGLATEHASLNVNGTSQSAEAAAAAAKVSDSSLASASTAPVSDKTSVSSTGGLVAQALRTSDVRQDKVASLQAAIASETYHVSSSDVASKMVDSMLG